MRGTGDLGNTGGFRAKVNLGWFMGMVTKCLSEHLFSLTVLCFQNVSLLWKRASSIQYGYRKCGTHARVFSRTLAHGNIIINNFFLTGESST